MNNELNNPMDCARSYIRTTEPDELDNIFCYLDCPNTATCRDINFCLGIKRCVELELNNRHQNKLALDFGD